MQETLAGLIARYGSELTLGGADGERRVRAFLQPLHHRGWSSALRSWTDLGSHGSGRYLLLTDVCPAGFDMVRRGAEQFWLRRWERYEIGGRTLYYWAILTKEE